MSVIHTFDKHIVIKIRTEVHDNGDQYAEIAVATDLIDRDTLLAYLVRGQHLVVNNGGELLDSLQSLDDVSFECRDDD